MILWYIIVCSHLTINQLHAFEISQQVSKEFLRKTTAKRKLYEDSREIIETKRESCLDEFQQQKSPRRSSLSPPCAQYCLNSDRCQVEREPSACLGSFSSKRMLKFARKYKKICYIRVTEVLRYNQAEELCQEHDSQPAVINQISLFEYLMMMNMFNMTNCKGQCPEARGYYIGLRRQLKDNRVSDSEWIWANNVTWKQDENRVNFRCDDELSESFYVNTSRLCYVGSDGKPGVTLWNRGEPNNFRYNEFHDGEQCVEIIARADKQGSFEEIGKLNDIPCVKPALGVICQMNDTKPLNISRFNEFSRLIDFNQTEPDHQDLLDDLLWNLNRSSPGNFQTIVIMTAALQGLLSAPLFTAQQATNVFHVIDQLANVTNRIQAQDESLKTVTNKLLNFIDLFSGKIHVDERQTVSFIFDNINTSLTDVNIAQHQDWFMIISDPSKQNINTIVELNLRALTKFVHSSDNYRLIETIFSNFNLFPQTNFSNETNVNGPSLIGVPISYQIANLTEIQTDEDIIRYRIRVPKMQRPKNISCVYWSFEENNGSWISDGRCRFLGYTNDYAQCSCNHLTHFALLMLPESETTMQKLSEIEEFFLSFITYIGIGLSILGLLITLITYLLFRCSKKSRIHASVFMLCLSILAVNCLYIPLSLTKPRLTGTEKNPMCNVIGFFFHYFILTSFVWMFIVAVVQYMQFVRVFDTHVSHFFVKTSCIGWLVPLIFPFSVIVIGQHGGYAGFHRCWIADQILLYATFLGPILLIIICNIILFVLTIRSIFHHDAKIRANSNQRSKLQLGAAVCCFVSIGCTWLFGLLLLYRINFLHQLIFCIFNSLQGFLIFLFHVYLSKPKRELWQTFFLQHGLHPRDRPHSGLSDNYLINSKSQTSVANLSTLARPVKFRFTSMSSSSSTEHQGSIVSSLNPSYTDQIVSNSTARQIIETKRLSNPGVTAQNDSRTAMSQFYA